MKGTALALCLLANQAHASISVQDDYGNTVTLSQPARRVISMAPHATELLFAAGGGDHIVGAVSYSDYPEAAKRITRIGDNNQVDIERIAALKPDLLVVWLHGSSQRQVQILRDMGIPLFYSEPHKLGDIADSLTRLGRLLGTEDVAQRASADLREKFATLATRYANRPPVRVFYQVWDKPLFTLSSLHIVNDAIRLCGGQNIFAELGTVAPSVGIEAVLAQDPEAIIGTAEKHPSDGGVAMWAKYTGLAAAKRHNLMTLDGALLNRPGPRMVEGTAELCERLDQARRHRPSAE
jgi:iron complex transport system substrate-binding protein